MRDFRVERRTGGGAFLLDGEEFQVLSGALHYFRVLPEQWPHRLRMLRAMGLNTVETYVPWNLHEPRPGVHRDVGQLDAFLGAAADAGLLAIVRPGPYICAEWENGGLPSWLTGDREAGRAVRTSDPAYLAHVDRYFDRIVPGIARRQITRGGNVIMVQVENEYGSYGSDRAYLRHLADGLEARGIDVPLVTSDGAEDHFLTGGTLPGVLATVNFGSEPEKAFAALREHRADEPLMCMEYWCGWFDLWGRDHTTRDAADAADVLDRMLAMGASVNIYLAHGGTSFGTWAGANRAGPFQDGAWSPTVTSYDYDAPLDERGAPTEKFWRFREVLARYGKEPGGPPEPPATPPVLPPTHCPVTGNLALRDALDQWGTEEVEGPVPPTFEELGVSQGLVLYRVRVPGPRGSYPLRVDGLHDRAHVFVDGRLAGVLERDAASQPELTAAGPATVEVLVESMGRTNYGPRTGERKGVLGGILHERQYLHSVSARALPLDESGLTELRFARGHAPDAVPAFFRAELRVGSPADGFLVLPGWGKGYAWVNGFCLGRYWQRGPQRALFLPAPLLRAGANELVLLELDHAGGTPQVRPDAEPG